MSRLAQETYPNVSSSLPGDMRKPAALAFAAQCCDPGCKPKWTTWDDASGSSPKASRNGATSFWNQTAFPPNSRRARQKQLVLMGGRSTMTGGLAAKPRVARLEKTMFGAGKLSTISGAVAVQMVLFSAIITAPLMERYADSGLIFPVAKRVIDKSCIMMCDKWGPNSCEKWVTRCKGDPGYPKTIRQLERSP